MNELADRLAEQMGMSKRDAQQFLTAVVETIQEGVNNDKLVKIKGLGTFKVIDVDARESVNVNTGERVTIESHQKLTFTPDSTMKELVNKPFSQFETVILNEGVDFDDLNKIADDDIFVEEPAVEIIEEEVPVVDNPVVETPIIETPVVDAPVVDAPVVEAPVEEPKEEETLVVETPVVEEKAPLIDEPVLVVDEEAPVTETTPGMEEEEMPTTETTSDIEEEEETISESSRSYWWLWLLIGVVACVISFAGGYIFGRQMDRYALFDSESTKTDSVVVASSPVVAPKDTLKANTVKNDSVKQEVKKVVESEKKDVAEQPKNVEAEPVWKKYEKRDSRVRTGAYYIVGLDHTVKAKSGDTTKRIAKRTLGEGMECYIEVFNNITSNQSLKEGQDIKIPKLELKKKRKKE